MVSGSQKTQKEWGCLSKRMTKQWERETSYSQQAQKGLSVLVTIIRELSGGETTYYLSILKNTGKSRLFNIPWER